MEEQMVRDGMRDAVSGEPPLGFDPDRLTDKAARTQRKRRAMAGTGLATLAVLAGVATVPAALGGYGNPSVIPAAPPVVRQAPEKGTDAPAAEKPTEPETASGGEINWPEKELTAHERKLTEYAVRAVTEVAPKVSDVHLVSAYVEETGKPGTDTSRSLHITVGFTDEAGPTSVSLTVYEPGAFPQEPSCTEPNSTAKTVRCRIELGENGSKLMTSLLSLEDGPKVPSVRTVRHHRRDGTVVSASAYIFNPEQMDPDKLRAETALDRKQLTELATDTRLTLVG